MFKKMLFLAGGGLLVLGLLFGRNLVPYAGTAITKAQSWADSQVDTEYKIETARNLLKKVENRIEPMVYEIARQKVQVEHLGRDIKTSGDALVKSEMYIKKLRNHLGSGESSYVSTSGNRYANQQVTDKLESEFRRFKMGEERLQALQTTYDARQNGLLAAQDNLEATHAKRIELSTQIDNLEAQLKMLEVAKTASTYNKFDNSELARTQEMIDEIETRIDTEAVMLKISPQYDINIPMDDDTEEGDIIEAIDAYFGSGSDSVVKS